MRSVQYIPHATEKAYAVQTQNTYIFFVPMKASKQEIAKQISEAFKVTVINVRTAVRKGKPTRFSRGKHAYPGITYQQDKKIAYVTVKEGDKIPVFEEEAKETKEDKKTEKATKKEEKLAAKETKKVDQLGKNNQKEDK